GAGELVEERLVRTRWPAGRLDHERGRAPQDVAGELQGVADQLPPVRQTEPVGEGESQSREGAAESGELRAREALAGEEEVRAEGHHEGCRIEEQDAARGRGEPQTGVDAHELRGEEGGDAGAVEERAIPVQQGDATERAPRQEEKGGAC